MQEQVHTKNDNSKNIPALPEEMRAVPGSGDTMLIDIGTTTAALALIDRGSGILRRTSVFINPQKTWGADVISRIQAACGGHGGELKAQIVSGIREQVEALCRKNNQPLSDITACFIGGNTTMIHLLMGYDCAPLAQSPFAIQEKSPAPFYYSSCQVTIMPWLSAFVGGDITAGLLACRMIGTDSSSSSSPSSGPRGGTSLLIDLGTNGEMVLCHNNTLYTAATAAGPAFEGGGLSCGCPAIPGAIHTVRYKRLQPSLSTIDNKLPVGICGSGAVSLCAELLRNGFVNGDGILSDRFPREGLLLSRSADGRPLRFTPDDFRNIQLASAAVAAGIDTLSRAAVIRPSDIPVVCLGGSFGFYLDPEDCRTLKMLSSLDPRRIRVMGNTCLRGLWEYAVSFSGSAPLSLPPVRHIPLAESGYFRERFLHHMTYSD